MNGRIGAEPITLFLFRASNDRDIPTSGGFNRTGLLPFLVFLDKCFLGAHVVQPVEHYVLSDSIAQTQ